MMLYNQLGLPQPAVIAENGKKRILKRICRKYIIFVFDRVTATSHRSVTRHQHIVSCRAIIKLCNNNDISIDRRLTTDDHNDDKNNNILIGLLRYRYRNIITCDRQLSTCVPYYYYYFSEKIIISVIFFHHVEKHHYC